MESDFLKDNECRCVCSIGSKGSGKTTLFCNYLKYCYQNNLFDKYYLCIPEIHRAKGGTQYSFIKSNKKTTIFTKYNQSITDTVVKKATGKEKILFVIEDATQYGKDIKNDQKLMQLMTCSRHVKCQVWLILHASKNVMSVPIRANLDYIFIHKITNRMLLESIWEEYFSLYYFPKFYDFLEYFKNIQKTSYNGIFINTIKVNYEEIKNLNILSKEESTHPQIHELGDKTKKNEIKNKNFFSKLLLYNK